MDLVSNHLYNSPISQNAPTTSSFCETIPKLLSTTKNEVSENISRTPSTKELSQQNRDVISSNFLHRSHVCSHSETNEEKASADSRPQNHRTNMSSAEKDIEVCIRELLEVQENFRKNRQNLSSNEMNESGLDVNCNTPLSSSPGDDSTDENYELDTVHQLAALKGCVKRLRRIIPDAVYMDKVKDVMCAGKMVEINIFSKSDTPEGRERIVCRNLEMIKTLKHIKRIKPDVRVLDSPKQYNINEVERVRLATETTIINFDIGIIREAKADMITDHRVLQAAENILLAKIDWSRDNNIRYLMSEKMRLDHKMETIKNKKKLIETRLLEERKLKAEEMEQIHNANIREKLEEQAKVQRFVLHLEGRDKILADVLDQLKAGRLSDVVKSLLYNFDVRLLGVDCGLNFLLEGPVTLKNGSMLRQLEETLEELLPENQRRDTKWENGEWDLTHTEDLEVGKVSPVLIQVAADNRALENVDLSNEPSWTPPHSIQRQITEHLFHINLLKEPFVLNTRHPFARHLSDRVDEVAERKKRRAKSTSSMWNKIKGAVGKIYNPTILTEDDIRKRVRKYRKQHTKRIISR